MQVMRLTVRFDDEVYAAARKLAAERDISVGTAINDLARAGLKQPPKHEEFVQITYPMGMKVDCTNIGEVLDLLDREEYGQ